MKRFFSISLILLSFVLLTNAQTFYGTTDIQTFRDGRDKELRNKDESPLKEVDFPNYKGLFYFQIDNKYRVNAKFTKTSDEKYFLMPTSAGKAQKYIKYAVLDFKLNNEDHSLNVYHVDEETREKYPEYKDLLFIPFRDLTNGNESYGGGRYLYILDTSEKEVVLDFNLASNPSCAYGSDRFSCPLPPKENFLKTEIKAGEKNYPYSKKSH
jgi:uncharacterized protein (DUF1684 family)